MQSVVLYFIRFYKDNESIQKYGPTFMKKILDQNILEKSFVLQWFDKTIRLDKDCALYDKPAEKKFRDLIEDFVKWLREQDSDSSGSESSEEEKNSSPKQKEEMKETEQIQPKSESEAQKRQRENIEKQKKAMEEQALALKQKVKEDKAKEEEKQETSNRVNLKALNEGEEIDLDDI